MFLLLTLDHCYIFQAAFYVGQLRMSAVESSTYFLTPSKLVDFSWEHTRPLVVHCTILKSLM